MPPFNLSSLVSVLTFFLPSCQARILNHYLTEAVVIKPFFPGSFVDPKRKHKCVWCHALTWLRSIKGFFSLFNFLHSLGLSLHGSSLHFSVVLFTYLCSFQVTCVPFPLWQNVPRGWVFHDWRHLKQFINTAQENTQRQNNSVMVYYS